MRYEISWDFDLFRVAPLYIFKIDVRFGFCDDIGQEEGELLNEYDDHRVFRLFLIFQIFKESKLGLAVVSTLFLRHKVGKVSLCQTAESALQYDTACSAVK